MESNIAAWTNLKEDLSGFIETGDFVVLGHVSELQSNVLKTETCEMVLDFESIGLDDLFGVSILKHKLTNKRCLFVGFKHSYWGSASGFVLFPYLATFKTKPIKYKFLYAPVWQALR